MNFENKILSIAFITLLFGMKAAEAQTTVATKSLSGRQQGIVAIAALTAKGNQQALSTEMANGLDAGLSINEIKEILVQLSAYTGFPRTLNAINTFKAVADERKNKGISDAAGAEPLKLDSTTNRYELGKRNLEKLSGQPENGKAGYAQFVPVIEVFLKEHLFADIFSRGVLNYQDRELVTVSALTSLGGVEGQLQGHLRLSIYNGFTAEQLEQMLGIVAKLVGKPEADAGAVVLDKVLKR